MKNNLFGNLHFSKLSLFASLMLCLFQTIPFIQSQTTVTFNYTGAPQNWTVPSGVYAITIEAYGAQGQNSECAGNYGGFGSKGGYATGELAVTPGQVLDIYVGGQTGYNGGGLAYCCPAAGCKGGNGGGASDVRVGGNALANRVIVAGAGGGGGGGEYPFQGGDGGAGGGLNGTDATGSTGPCAPYSGQGGYGGTQSAGGAGGCGGLFPTDCYYNGYPGGLGVGGNGNNQDWRGGGGGGGGYYGGGGGGSFCANGGGGGGSSYIGGVTNGSTNADQNAGNGIVNIIYGECDITLNCPANISLNSDPNLCSATYNFPSALVLQYNPVGSVCGNTPIPPTNLGLGYTAGNLTTVGLLDWCNTGTLPIGKITGSPTVPAGEYLTFTVSVPGGTRFAKLNYDKTSYLGTGPTKASIRSSLNGYSTDISMISVNPGGSQSLEFNLSGMAPVSGSITFRIYFYGAPVDLSDWADLDGTERGKNGIRMYAFNIASAIDCNGNVPDMQYTNISPTSTYPVGTTTITATATSQNGATASCSFDIIVTDTQTPNITKCPDSRNIIGCNTAVINSPAYNENETTSSYSVYSSNPNNGTANDNCGITSVTYKDSKSGSCPIVVTRTWKIKDNAGNSKTCNQQININEPSINFSCGSSVTMSSCSSTTIGNAYNSFLLSTTGSGGCNGSMAINAPNNPPGICGGTVSATWIYTTDCNVNSCTKTFTVNAPAAVSIECPENKNEGLCQTQTAINNSYSNWLNSVIFSGGCNASVSNNGGAAPSRYGGSKTVTWTVTSSCQGPVSCTAVFTVSGADDDCDGLGNGCDQCPGGDDKIDNNNDGKPDCKYPPSNINQIINAWKCSGNTKVQVCSKSPGGYKTVCTYLSAVQNHINAGGYLGPCGNSGCGGGNLKRIEKNEFMSGEEVVYEYDHTASDYQGIELYPNPAQNMLFVKVQSNSGDPVELVLYNNIGQKLFAETYSMNHQNELVIPVGISNFSNGLYFVKVLNGLERNVKSFTIQK